MSPLPPITSPETLGERLRALPAYAALAPRLPAAPPIHLVGGAVRDLLLGIAPPELDLAVEGDAEAVARAIADGPPRLHPRFGTATAPLGSGTVDLARTRRETYRHPGALPDVDPAGLEADLSRRDFTVNAMAVALNGPSAGTMRAAPRAPEDLAAGRLRVLHPASFRDDPTRLLRLARYAGRLGFTIEPETRRLAEAAREEGALQTVSRERISTELRLLAAEADPAAGFAVLHELGLDAAIAPGYGIGDPARLRRALGLLADAGRRDLLVLGLAAEGASGGLPLGPETGVVDAVARAGHLTAALAGAERPSEIAAAVGETPPEAVAAAGAAGDPAAERAARRWLEELRHVALEIDGGTLVAAGIPPGPAIGAGLRAALAGRLDGELPNRAAELGAALEAARAHR